MNRSSMSFTLVNNWNIKVWMSRAGMRRHRPQNRLVTRNSNENLTLRLNAQEEPGGYIKGL
jgi:hypothetical protein